MNTDISEDSIFHGDGREMVQPTVGLPYTQPMPVRRHTARLLIKMLADSGRSAHSPAAGTLWIALHWLHETGQPYVLTAHPGYGYTVELVPTKGDTKL